MRTRFFWFLSTLLLFPGPAAPTINQLWYLGVDGVTFDPDAVDRLGSATAAGDFDGDGYQDLAIGIPGRGFLFFDDPGAVLVLYGSETGLVAANSQLLRQTGEEEGFEDGDQLGLPLAVGDFNGDSYDDLAAGAQMEEVGGDLEAGAVSVFYGGPSGLGDHEIWHQDVPGIQGAAETGDRFGYALAAGDFDCDDFVDLAVGAPSDSVDGQAAAGLVSVIYGSADGLVGPGSQRLRQGFDDLIGFSEVDDFFGGALASGDFDGDTCDDLAIGAPGEGFPFTDAAGAVTVIPGTSEGLSTLDAVLWAQGLAGMQGERDSFDHFGLSLAAGDFNGDDRADLAVGTPGEDVVDTEDGQLHIIFGSPDGLSVIGNAIVDKLTPGIVSISDHEFFASSLAMGDVDGDGLADITVGTPGQDVQPPGEDPISNAGGVHLIHGSTTGLGTIEWISLLDAPDVSDGPPRTMDLFGSAVAVGDFDGNGSGELAAGIPFRLVSGLPAAGAVLVVRSALFADGFETGDTSGWSATAP
ncbi:MAG: integrin alpha [Thermoanaerobaculia bacterium]|nr:integrin alpha [Thermoanaerobaculia bacterium]